jgi:chaperone modulatory protein CbpM
MINERELVDQIDALTLRQLRSWVRRGWVRPAGSRPRLAFSDLDVARVELICQLRQEMEVTEQSMPVVLTLLDQVYGLREQMRRVVAAIEAQPNAVKRDIARQLEECEIESSS